MSLTELMLALFISSLLTALLIHQYLGVSQHHQTLTKQTESHLEQTLLEKTLIHAIEQAGFLPCGGQMNFKLWDATQGKETLVPALEITNNTLISHHMHDQFSPIFSTPNGQYLATEEISLQPRQAVVLTNCHQIEINQVKSIEMTGRYQRISMLYPSQFEPDCDSYIGAWMKESFTYHRPSIFYGNKRKERLTDNVEIFQSERIKPELIHIRLKFPMISEISLTIRNRYVFA